MGGGLFFFWLPSSPSPPPAAGGGAASREVGYRDAAEVIVYHVVKPRPQTYRRAFLRSRTFFRSVLQTGNRRDPALGGAENVSDNTFPRRLRQPVAALRAPLAVEKSVPAQHRHYLLKIFQRNALPLRRVLQRNIPVAHVFCNICHKPDGVSSLGRYFQKYPSSRRSAALYRPIHIVLI